MKKLVVLGPRAENSVYQRRGLDCNSRRPGDIFAGPYVFSFRPMDTPSCGVFRG